MKHTKISTLAAAVALACSGAAHAFDVSLYNPSDPNTVTLKIGGSSAVDGALDGLMELGSGNPICVAGTLDVYKSADTNSRLYLCTASGDPKLGIDAGKKLAVFKYSAGGSGVGVGLVLNTTAAAVDGSTYNVKFFNPATLSSCAGTAVAASAPLAAYTFHGSCANPTAASTTPADAGVSDLEPAMFRSVFSPNLTDAQLNAISGNAITAVMTGTPVTLGIYHRLQLLQFPASSVCNPDNANYGTSITPANGVPTTNGDSEACMPSLTRSQLQGMYTGAITDWSQIVSSRDGTLNVANVPDSHDVALANTTVYIDSRVITSGTRGTIESEVTGQRCATGGLTLLSAASAPGIVFEGAGGGNVAAQLQADDAAGKGSIGLLDMTTTSVGKTFRWVKINGYAPTLLNAVNGSWTLFGEQSFNFLGSSINGFPALANQETAYSLAQPTGSKLALANGIIGLITQPVNIASIDKAKSTEGFGISGVLGSALQNTPPTPPFTDHGGGTGDVTVTPVLTSTRAITGVENSCLPPVNVGANTQTN